MAETQNFHGVSYDATDRRHPDHKLPLKQSIPFALQHLLAMFASNVTPPIIIASVAGLAGADKVLMIQAVMVFAGVATLLQSVGIGPVGARLPIVQGTSFAFVPVMISVVVAGGANPMGALFAACVVAGLVQCALGFVIPRLRAWLPPLVTGVVLLTIGLALIPVGVKYAAGGVPLIGTAEFGSLKHWGLALIVILVTLGVRFWARGFLSISAVLIGLIAGYLVALLFGQVSFAGVATAGWFALPRFAPFGFAFDLTAILAMSLMVLAVAVETVGNVSGIAKGGAGREATSQEMAGGTFADGLGTALAGLFGALPNTAFAQNAGLAAMTGVMSRHVTSLTGLFLLLAGFVPKIAAIISAMPIAVLGGGVLVMFGMIAATGIRMLSEVKFNRRNLFILALSFGLGLGFKFVPESLQHLPKLLQTVLGTGILPAAFLAIALNALLPESSDDTAA